MPLARVAGVVLLAACTAAGGEGAPPAGSAATVSPTAGVTAASELVVRVLDVGQGDATLIENGGSRALIDGGPDLARMDHLLDSLHLDDSTIDVVVLTHQHADHLIGLRALFESRRHIRVRYFFENKDPYTTANLRHLRDSIAARVARGELVYRDTDDPCANGTPICTIAMRGGARLHLMRPMPGAANPNDRSAAIKLVGPDSASFTMWLAGDAEQDEIGWFLGAARYDVDPGMRVDVLKADHHGSCNGLSNAYLDATRPSLVTVSVGAANSYRHMHEQAKARYRAHHADWYRTDENGTIELRSPGTPGGSFTVAVQRGTRDLSGVSDRRSTQPQCNPVP